MKKTIFSIAALAVATVASYGQVTTDPVGFVSVTVKHNSDATIAVPMNRTAEFRGTVASVAGNVITVTGTPGWTANQFVFNGTTQLKTYALQISSNAGGKEGMIGKITANTTTSVTVQLDGGDSLAGISSGEQIDIMPYWTPATLFSVVPPVGFEVFGFNAAGVGINLGGSEDYVHNGSNAWEDGINGGDATNFPLRFGAALVARNSSGSDYTATFVGSVPMTTFRVRLSTLASGQAQDQFFGYMSPVPESLATLTNPNALGLPVASGDTIEGFDNSQVGINQGASELYTWNGTAWEDGINGGVIDSSVKLKPGFGYIFQKAPTTPATSVVWSHVQSYLQ